MRYADALGKCWQCDAADVPTRQNCGDDQKAKCNKQDCNATKAEAPVADVGEQRAEVFLLIIIEVVFLIVLFLASVILKIGKASVALLRPLLRPLRGTLPRQHVSFSTTVLGTSQRSRGAIHG